MKDLDPKSLIIGFLTAVLVTVAMGNALAANQVGKYQLAVYGAKKYVVDTTNGKVGEQTLNHTQTGYVWKENGLGKGFVAVP